MRASMSSLTGGASASEGEPALEADMSWSALVVHTAK
jgi:hypothetical protein